ncbi:hypothetical protein LJY25_14835 [Hymenobacter sp. BT175]|uniref:hypothetical protein n=1 Tax=Hymenobacter translucens TaxID=2886507 RepID=UPI001D0EEF1F|nr:hypothetical protein [Hymenobacter translucens]MCC2547729.1 hypothetical protein [Hymenobacter translucens]
MNLIPKWWRDITENPPGHTVAKDLFRAQAFYAGLALCFWIAYADFRQGRGISFEPALFLLSYALGASALKAYEKFQDRKTADGAGNPLAVPNPPGYTPPIMDQVPNPNAANHPVE